MNDVIWQAIRYTLIAAGTWAAAKKWIPVEQVQDLANNVISFLSLGVSIGTAIWGFYVSWRTKRVPLATAQRSDVPTINPATGAVEAPDVVR